MIPLPSGVRVWIAAGHSDMRRGMQSLALQVQEGLNRDPHAGDLYVFRGPAVVDQILWHDGIGMSLTPSGWSAAGSFGRRPPPASF
jgi:transposase